MRLALALLAVAAAAHAVGASTGRPVDIPERARGADIVVVGTVTDVHSSFASNSYGDQLIVSRANVLVDETLKGQSRLTTVTVEIEGGTVGDLTLKVSDLPSLEAGERATFFLTRGASGTHVPHLRGLGIVKVDRQGRVPGSSLTLEAMRRMVRATQQ